MGEYADMALEESISEYTTWGWRRYKPRQVAPGKPIKCRHCGHPALYWEKHEDNWRLHHWACVPLDTPPRYILHKCGFTSDGKPKPARDAVSRRLAAPADGTTTPAIEASAGSESAR